MSAATPVIAWSGRATSRRGRTSRYRVVVRPDLAAASKLPEAHVDPRKVYTVERCGRDAMGESSWNDCGHSAPKSVIAELALALAELKGGVV